jgi:hypothetical protein
MGSFNLGNMSKSGGLMSGFYGAWGNTSHLYLLSKSVTTFPRCGCALSCKMSGQSPRKSGRFLCNFMRNFCIQSLKYAAFTLVPHGTLSDMMIPR